MGDKSIVYVFISFLKGYRYRDTTFQAYLGLLTALNDLSKKWLS